MPLYRAPGGVFRRRAWVQPKRRPIWSFVAGNVSTDAGTIPVTITMSGTDQLASTDAGTIPLTITMSGADSLASVDAGAIPITIAMSGVEFLSSTDAGTIPLTITMSGVEVWGSHPAGQGFDDLRHVQNPILPIR